MELLKEFEHKVVLVTGSSSGIGEECVALFAQLGANVVVNGRDEQKCQRVAQKCRQLSPFNHEPLVVVADVTQLDAIEQMVGQIESTFGRLDVVVNNAAKGGGSEEESVEEFEDYFRANTRSVYALCTRAKPLLEKSGGAIVNISSINGLKPFPNVSYCVSKAALDMLTRCLAQNWGPLGIRVNGLNPGQIDTPIWTQPATGMTRQQVERMFAAVDQKYPVRRRGYPEDIARSVVFLSSKQFSGFITGINVRIDGGFLDSQQLIWE